MTRSFRTSNRNTMLQLTWIDPMTRILLLNYAQSPLAESGRYWRSFCLLDKKWFQFSDACMNCMKITNQRFKCVIFSFLFLIFYNTFILILSWYSILCITYAWFILIPIDKMNSSNLYFQNLKQYKNYLSTHSIIIYFLLCIH